MLSACERVKRLGFFSVFFFFLQSSNAICQAQLGKRKVYRKLPCVFIWLRALGADALMICNCTLPFIVEDVVKGGMR